MADDMQSVAFEIGKISGQLRELIHTTNNNSQQLTSLGTIVSQLAGLPESLAHLSARVAVLEKEINKLEGAKSVWGSILKHPAVMWLAGLAVAAYTFLSDHPIKH